MKFSSFTSGGFKGGGEMFGSWSTNRSRNYMYNLESDQQKAKKSYLTYVIYKRVWTPSGYISAVQEPLNKWQVKKKNYL